MSDPKLRRKVLTLALPLMVGNLSQIFISLTDTWFMGRLGRTELAAMGQAGVAYLIVFLVLSAAFMGIQALTARRFGEEKPEACGEIFNTGLAIQITIGLTAGLLGYLFMPTVVEAVYGGTDDLDNVLPLTSSYLQLRASCVIVMTTLWAFRGFFYGIGVTKPDLFAGVGMNVVNIIGNYAFIFGKLGAPKMGMDGAALASVLATGSVSIMMATLAFLPRFRKKYGLYRLSKVKLQTALSILKLSGPRAMQALAFGGSVVFFKLIGDSCGETALAASIIVWRCFGISVLVALALGAASATLVGQNLGAGNPDRAELGARAAIRIGVTINMGLGLIALVMPDLLLGIFTNEPEVIAAGRAPMRLMAFFQAVDAIGIILGRSLSAAGCVFFVMRAEILIQLGIMVPAALISSHYFPGQLMLMWFAWAFYVTAWATTMMLKFRGGSWRQVQI